MNTTIDRLYQFVQTRPKPEDVAAYIVEHFSSFFTEGEIKKIKTAARHSLRHSLYSYSSMATDFVRPAGAEKQVKIASELFCVPELTSEDCFDAEKVRKFVETVSTNIRKAYGASSFKFDRLNREQRKAAKIPFKSHRSYNKRFRLLVRMENKIDRMIRERIKYELTRVGKSSFAVEIPYEDFKDHVPTACFVAYMAARMSRRSVFTNQSQSRAYDEVAKVMFDKLTKCPNARWDVAASVMPTDDVLTRLSDEQKGRMLARVWKLFEDASTILKHTYTTFSVDKKTMIVKRGCDSSTWNQVAGGWNELQENWRSLVISLGMGSMMKDLCVGKVMRLMAADVARWHKMSGGDVHPATKVWADLPLPWEVISGNEVCTRDMVIKACERHGVDPETWVGAKIEGKAEKFQATPELVHGVTVCSPSLAKALKKAGVFSGKALKFLPEEDFEVERDDDGFATLAKEISLKSR